MRLLAHRIGLKLREGGGKTELPGLEFGQATRG